MNCSQHHQQTLSVVRMMRVIRFPNLTPARYILKAEFQEYIFGEFSKNSEAATPNVLGKPTLDYNI